MLNIKLTNHFTSRFRKRIAQVKNKNIDKFDFKYMLWLRKECSKYITGSKRILYSDLPIEIQHKFTSNHVFYVFQHKILFITNHINNENEQDLILLITVYKINLSSNFYLLS